MEEVSISKAVNILLRRLNERASPSQHKSLSEAPAHYRVDRRMNPFYLRGDFNGDSHPDYAVLVEETASGKKGIAVCFGGLPSELHVLAAGTPFAMEGNRKVDDFGQFFDVWSVVEKGKLSPRGEGIYLQRAEAGGGLILWDGHRFLWEQWGI